MLNAFIGGSRLMIKYSYYEIVHTPKKKKTTTTTTTMNERKNKRHEDGENHDNKRKMRMKRGRANKKKIRMPKRNERNIFLFPSAGARPCLKKMSFSFANVSFVLHRTHSLIATPQFVVVVHFIIFEGESEREIVSHANEVRWHRLLRLD